MNAPHVHKPSKPWVLQAVAVLAISVLVSLATAFFVSNYLNDKVKQQGRNGLELFYTQALAQCRDTRQNSLKLKKFSDILTHQFLASQKAAELSSVDPKLSKVQRDAAAERVLGYQRFLDALPHPIIKDCTDVVKSPEQLAQQVRDKPGKSTTTTTPKGKK